MKLHLSLLLVVLLAGFAGIARAQSWGQPAIVGEAPNAKSFQFSPDGRWLLANYVESAGLRYPQHNTRLFDLRGEFKPRGFNSSFERFTADSRRLISFDFARHELQIADVKDGRVLQKWAQLAPQPNEDVQDVQFQQGGRELVALTPFRVWRLDVANGKILSQVKIAVQSKTNGGSIPSFGHNLLNDGQRIYYLYNDEAALYSARTGRRIGKAAMGFLSPDQSLLFNWDQHFWVGDFATGATLWQAPMNQPRFAGNGKTLVSVDKKLGVRLLDARSGNVIRQLDVPVPRHDNFESYAPFALSPSGKDWIFLEGDTIVRYRLV